MKLLSIQLQHFRNYNSLNLDLTEHPVLALIGPNAQGKTNLLEAIAYLALGKSFRSRKSIESLQWEQAHGRIKGQLAPHKNSEKLESSQPPTELEVFLQRQPQSKKLKKNQKACSPKAFLGHLRIVLFTPDTLLMIHGSPRLRRQFLDRILIVFAAACW